MKIFNILNAVNSWNCEAALCLYNFGMFQQKSAQLLQNTHTHTTTLHRTSCKYPRTSGKQDGTAAQHCSGTGQSFQLSILMLPCTVCIESHLLSPMHQSCGSGVWERTENAKPRHAGQSHMLLLNMHAPKGVVCIDLYMYIIFLQHSLVVSGRHLLFESSIYSTLLQTKKTSTCARNNIFFPILSLAF